MSRQRSFDKPGTYTLKAYGAFVSRGLQSAEKCAGTLQAITLVVYDPNTKPSPDDSPPKASSPEVRGRIGVEIGEVNLEVAEALSLKAISGALVRSVDPEGPARKAGIEPGDVVLGFAGQEVVRWSDLPLLVEKSGPGLAKSIDVWRRGEKITLSVDVVEYRPTRKPAEELKLSSQDFEVYFFKLRRFGLLKKLDGTKVFANPSSITNQGPIPLCLISLSSDFNQERLVLLNSVLPIHVRSIVREMGVSSDNPFEIKDCLSYDMGPNNASRKLKVSNTGVLVIQEGAVSQVSQTRNFSEVFEKGATISSVDINQTASAIVRENEKREKDLAERTKALNELANSKSMDKIGSLTFSLPDSRNERLKICTRRSADTDFRLALIGYFARDSLPLSGEFLAKTAELQATVDRKWPITSQFDTVDDFYLNHQRKPTQCQVYVDYPENLQKIANALGDGKYEINPLISKEEAMNDAVKSQGYADYETYKFAQEVGADLKMLGKLAELGVWNSEAFNDVVARMREQKYSDVAKPQDVIMFIQDEKEGAEKKLTAKNVKDQREKAIAKENARLEREKARLEKERERIVAANAKKYPSLGGDPRIIGMCLGYLAKTGPKTWVPIQQRYFNKHSKYSSRVQMLLKAFPDCFQANVMIQSCLSSHGLSQWNIDLAIGMNTGVSVSDKVERVKLAAACTEP